MVAGMSSAAQAQGLYTPYGPYGPALRPYNPYLPFTPGQQRGWQEAKIYEQTGMLPNRFMTPNEAETFNRTITRDAWRQAYPGSTPRRTRSLLRGALNHRGSDTYQGMERL